MQTTILRRAALTILTATLTTTAQAANPSTELRVTGVVRPVACTLRIGNGNGASVVRYEAIARSQLKAASFTKLELMEIDFAINCDGAIKVAVHTTDAGVGKLNGLASLISSQATEAAMFGLGVADSARPDSTQIGAFHLAMKPGSFNGTKANDAPVNLHSVFRAAGADNGRWNANVGGSMSTANELSWAPPGSDTPTAYNSIAGKLTVQAVINKLDALPSAQEFNLNGAATIELRYL